MSSAATAVGPRVLAPPAPRTQRSQSKLDVEAFAADIHATLRRLPVGSRVLALSGGPSIDGEYVVSVRIPGQRDIKLGSGRRISALDQRIALHLSVRCTPGTECGICTASTQAERRRHLRQWDKEEKVRVGAAAFARARSGIFGVRARRVSP